MSLCPACGQVLPADNEARRLLHLLKGEPHRMVYLGSDGGWYVTYGGGPFSGLAVRILVERGEIQSVYNSIPDEAYHVGRTWDCERTLAARKKLGKAAPDYYVGDPA